VKLRLSKTAGLAAAALVFAGVLAAQPLGSVHWKSKTEIVDGPQGDRTTESEMWMKDKKLRMKTTAMGMNMNIVKSGDVLYQWQEGQTSGMKMSASMRRRGGPSADYVGKIDEIRARGKKIGTETVAGHECDIYEYSEATGERPGKQTYWLARDMKNFPVKVVNETGGLKITTLNSDIDLKASVLDAMLEPPADVKFQDMSEMMKGR
jgi:Domain of unknown function (DUF4412)